MLQVHVGISSNDRISAYLHSLVVYILHSKLLNGRAVIGSIVWREVAHVAAYLDAQHLADADAEEQIQVGVDVELG